MVTRLIAADLDGTLVRAKDIHYDALNLALQKISDTTINEEEHETTFNGLPTRTKLSLLIQQGRVRQEDVSLLYEEKQRETFRQFYLQIKLDPAIIEIGSYWKKKGFLVACVTNAIRTSAEIMLSLCGIRPFVDLVISNEDVVAPKPNPAGYLKAMSLLGIGPDETIIIEDAPKGIAAAEATRCSNVWRVRDVDEVNVENFKQFFGNLLCKS